MARNFYVVLGVPRDASVDAIRSAYRRLAKQLHPDRAGVEATKRFRDVTEAYEVLSDPGLRRSHNAELEPVITSAARPASEPLGRPFAGVSLDRAVRLGPSPFADELRDWMRENTLGSDLPKSGRRAVLDLDVLLSPDEATRGGELPLELPLFVPCVPCGGTGRDWLFVCALCAGEGAFPDRVRLRVRIPPGMRDATIWELPDVVAGTVLRLHVRVDDRTLP